MTRKKGAKFIWRLSHPGRDPERVIGFNLDGFRFMGKPSVLTGRWIRLHTAKLRRLVSSRIDADMPVHLVAYYEEEP